MKPDPSKLRQEHQQREEAAETQIERQLETGREFGSVEDMMRFDSEHTTPPERVAERLKESVAREPARPRSWWRRLFGS